MAELKDARDFPKALALLQSIDMTLYIVAAVVIYRYTGADVASPALGSAGPMISKVAYGIALPTVRPNHSLNYAQMLTLSDCNCWRYQRPCCRKIALRPYLCWHRPDAQERLDLHWLLGGHCLRALGHRLGHRRSNSCV